MLQFSPVDIGTKSDIDKITFSVNCHASQYCFSNLFCLQEKYNTEFCITDNILYIRQSKRDTPTHIAYLMPIGTGDFNVAIKNTEEHAASFGKLPLFYAVPNDFISNFPDNYFTLENRDWADYIYFQKDLASLEGPPLKNKRRDYNSFIQRYQGDFIYEPITPCDIDDVLEYQEKWLFYNLDHNPVSLSNENLGAIKALKNWEALNLKGGMIKTDNKIRAYTFGSAISHDIFDLTIEKADVRFYNIYKAINKLFALNSLGDYTYINREEDVGESGLRTSKLSYKPFNLLLKSNVYAK